MTAKQKHYAILAQTAIPNFEKRGIQACYVATAEEAKETVSAILSEMKTVSCGGSLTLSQIGFFDAVAGSGAEFLDRFSASTPEESDAITAKTAICDGYFMSTNAMTRDGLLLNIDGRGNRVASLICGPKTVVVVAGMNKMCDDLESAYRRVKLNAAPPNAIRLGRQTPCAVTGKCADCLSADCICAQIVVTRLSMIRGRIRMILVGEDLGF